MESQKKKKCLESFPLQQRERGEKGRKPMVIWPPLLPSKHNLPPPFSLFLLLLHLAVKFGLVHRL